MIHCTTATYRQPIHLSLHHSRSEPFMNGFFSCTLYSGRWETQFLLYSALMLSTWGYNFFLKTPFRTISPQHYVCKIHVTKTLCGEQGFIYLLGFKILYIYIILLRHLAMWTRYTNRTVNSEIQDQFTQGLLQQEQTCVNRCSVQKI